MFDANAPFSVIQNRLFSLSNQSEYVPDFDMEKVIEDLKVTIWTMQDRHAVEKLNLCLYKIKKLLSSDNDFHSYFVNLHKYRHETPDEFGNICYEEGEEYLPLPVYSKQTVNDGVRFELSYYEINLNNLLNDFKMYALSKNREAQTDDKDTVHFQYLHSDVTKITDLYKSLINHHFISQKTTLPTFKKIFGSKSRLEKRIFWTGDASELAYIVKTLIKRNVISIYGGLGKWRTTKIFFSLHEDGREMSLDLSSQHPPQKRIQLIETIIGAFS